VLVIAIGILLAHVLIVASLATVKGMPDADDTSGRLDVRTIRHAHHRSEDSERFFVHDVRTYAKWSSRLLNRDATEVTVWFDNGGGSDADRVVYIDFRGGRLQAEMARYRSSGDAAEVTMMGEVRVSRPDRRTVRVFVPRRWVKQRHLLRYGWWVTTYFLRENGDACRRWYACADRAPTSGLLEHRV